MQRLFIQPHLDELRTGKVALDLGPNPTAEEKEAAADILAEAFPSATQRTASQLMDRYHWLPHLLTL
jgi:hypothetical protein